MPKVNEKKGRRKISKAKPAAPVSTKTQTPDSRLPRRFVRIEVSSPVAFVPFRVPLAQKVDLQRFCSGNILNISGGGVLLETETWVQSADYLLLRIGLFDKCQLENVVARVKRIESAGDGKCLLGAEFLTREMLAGLTADLRPGFLPEGIGVFDEKLRELLSRQVFSRKANQTETSDNSSRREC